MADVQVPLLPTHYYHIYNHAVGNELFFVNDADYQDMLAKLELYVLPVCHILSYCLMPNHFHFVIQVKSSTEISQAIIDRIGPDRFFRKAEADEYFISRQVSRHFANLFSSYAKHYNFLRDRTGTIFKRAFRRSEINDMEYFKAVIFYVHQNPVEGGIVSSMKKWEYSSYKILLSNSPTYIAREETLDLFGGLKNFNAYHSYKSGLN